MVAAIGLLTILALLGAILFRVMSPLVALIVIPIAGALGTGAGLDTASYMVEGLKAIAPVAAMFIFAIVFFGVLTDAGLFDPVITAILRVIGDRPVRVVIGSAVLAMVVHLDGSGAVTFLITIPPLLPVYDRLQLDRKILACVVGLAAGTMNIVPWGGPTLRAATSLHLSMTELYRPVLLPQIAGLAFVLVVAGWLGRREARRLAATLARREVGGAVVRELTLEERLLRRPRLFWLNAALTAGVIGALVAGTKLAPGVVFMVGAALALLVNYPRIADQRARVDAHARAALMMASILLAAGAFTGIMKGTGMITEMAKSAVAFVPPGLGSHIPILLAVLAMPLSLLFDPDSFYFGFLPVVAAVAHDLGVAPVAVGQAAIIGQMTTGFPVSPLTPATFLLVGMTQVDLAAHQRFTIPFAFATTILIAIVSVLCGLYPL